MNADMHRDFNPIQKRGRFASFGFDPDEIFRFPQSTAGFFLALTSIKAYRPARKEYTRSSSERLTPFQ